MDSKQHRRVRGQIGTCGIWCGSCVVGSGALMAVAGRLRTMVESHGLEAWGAEGFDYGAFTRALACVSDLEPCPGCRAGGGQEDCPMRACARDRGVSACPACFEFGGCANHGALKTMRDGAEAAGLTVAKTVDDLLRIHREADADLGRRWWWRGLFAEE